MNLDMLASRGLLPWKPSPDATNIQVWRRYDTPMIGTFRLDGRTVLFTLIGDTSQTVSVWAYVPVPVEDEDRFAAVEFDSSEQMMEFIDESFAGNEAVFVIAKDLKIWLWTRHEVPFGQNEGLLAAAAAALADMSKAVTGKRQSPGELFETELAHLEVAAEDLADV